MEKDKRPALVAQLSRAGIFSSRLNRYGSADALIVQDIGGGAGRLTVASPLSGTYLERRTGRDHIVLSISTHASCDSREIVFNSGQFCWIWKTILFLKIYIYL
jgi:hypothetical protein